MNTSERLFARTDLLLAFLLGCAALVIYLLTLTPSLSYLSPDGNELATIPSILGLAHPPGYPVYTWLGKVFTWLPIGDAAHRINLMSAVLGAMGVGGLYLIILTLLRPTSASVSIRRAGTTLAAFLFAFSPTFWLQAVIAEVYAPNIAFLAFVLLALLHWERSRRDRDFLLFSLIYGLSLGTHLSNLGFAPAFALFILLSDIRCLRRPTWWLAAFAGFGVGLAQFLWLPLRASSFDTPLGFDRLPTTMRGFYNYTLGAFSQLKFAFPVAALPERIVVYLDLLRQEFSILGIVIGIIGLAAILLRRPQHYYLLVGMYLVHVWFFIQYRVFDLEVFFLPTHFLWAIFLAFGIVEALAGWTSLVSKLPGKVLPFALRWSLVSITIIAALFPLLRNWSDNNRSEDVTINDFYSNVWENLPKGSVLLTQGGVFGYDAFYWRLVYNTRSDVALPALAGAGVTPFQDQLTHQDLYSTTTITDAGLRKGAGAVPAADLLTGIWQVPVIVGNQTETGFSRRGRLTLYRLSEEPPNLIVDSEFPQDSPLLDLGGLILEAASIHGNEVESGGLLHLTLTWQVKQLTPVELELNLGEQMLERHELGFGNLERYHLEVEPLVGKTIVEEYSVVIPSNTPTGESDLVLRVSGTEIKTLVGTVIVTNEEETMERWLRIAGKSPSGR